MKKRKRLRQRKKGRRPEQQMRRRRSGHEHQGCGSLASPPGHHDGVLPPQQTARLTQQMELMMRNKRDHFTVVLGKPQRLLGHLSDRASQSPGVRYGQLFQKCSPEQRLPGHYSALSCVSHNQPAAVLKEGKKIKRGDPRPSFFVLFCFILFYEAYQQGNFQDTHCTGPPRESTVSQSYRNSQKLKMHFLLRYCKEI